MYKKHLFSFLVQAAQYLDSLTISFHCLVNFDMPLLILRDLLNYSARDEIPSNIYVKLLGQQQGQEQPQQQGTGVAVAPQQVHSGGDHSDTGWSFLVSPQSMLMSCLHILLPHHTLSRSLYAAVTQLNLPFSQPLVLITAPATASSWQTCLQIHVASQTGDLIQPKIIP